MYYNRSYRHRRPPTVPINYSGNAFERPHTDRDNIDVMPIPVEAPIAVETVEAPPTPETVETERESVATSSRQTDEKKPNFLANLFGGKLFPRGIGNEELLLLALILLVAQSGESDELLIYLVILLLS